MRILIKKIILKFKKILNFTIVDYNHFNSLKEYQKDIIKILKIPQKKREEILKIIKYQNLSYSRMPTCFLRLILRKGDIL